MLQNFNYHTHTKRCGHAIGNDEEYIEAAIEAGFQVIGISEHLAYEGWDDEVERIAFIDMEQYFSDMQKLKELYKDKIEIRIGVEYEYFPDQLAYLQTIKKRCDYMINGQHAILRDNNYLHDKADDDEVLYMAELVCEGIRNGLSDYIAHPDYFMQGRNSFSQACRKAIQMIGDCAKEYNIPVEINLKGLKRGQKMYKEGMRYAYPFHEVWEILAQSGCKAILGYDAHSPSQLLDREQEALGRQFAQEHHIELLKEVNF